MKKILYILSAVAMLAGCSKHDVTDDTLPQGKYPMSFTAAVGELEVSPQSAPHSKAATRATDQLPMRVSIDNGANYTDYTLSADGSLTPANVGEELYWTKTTEQVTAYTAVTIGSGGIDIADQSNGWGMLGYVGVVPAKTYTFRKAPITLTLQPATAKVNVNLVAGDGVSETELSAATVVLSGYTQATMNASTFALEGSGANSAITPKGSNKTFEALLVPQQMQGKRFVRVTFGGLNYYYTPTNATDANLAAGKQYTFTITVNKGGITVTASGATTWTGSETDVTSKDPASGFGASDLKIGDYYYSDGTTGDGGYREYTDGSKATLPIMPVLTDASNQPRTVIGIVYWVGDPTNTTNGDPLLKTNHPSCTHGLVVALHEAKNPLTNTTAGMKWSVNTEQVNNWTNHGDRGANKVDITEQNRYQGYANTVALKAYNAQQSNADLKVLPIAAIEQYNTDYPAPSNSSGWYVPSIMELKYMCWGQGATSESTAGRDLLNGQFAKAGGTNFDVWSLCWSSSESVGYGGGAWIVSFYNGSVNGTYKDNGEFWVRALFAF